MKSLPVATALVLLGALAGHLSAQPSKPADGTQAPGPAPVYERRVFGRIRG
jgi:hypothetical protein